jgi:hypothetical protein
LNQIPYIWCTSQICWLKNTILVDEIIIFLRKSTSLSGKITIFVAQKIQMFQAAGLRLDVITSNTAIASLGAAWPLALARLRRLTDTQDTQDVSVTTVTANAVMGACERRCPAEWNENQG